MNNRMSRLAFLSALAMSSGLFSVASESEVESEPRPRYVPPPFPPQLAPPPPPLTPEQIKAQEKRARRAAKRAMQNQVVNPDPRAISKLINFGVPRGLNA